MMFAAFSRKEYVFLIMVLVAATACLSFFLLRSGKTKERVLSLFIFLNALILHVFYIAYTQTWERQHDVIGFGNEKGIGQAALIEYLMNTGHLPNFNPTSKWGFFQPLLHHIIAALFLRINLLTGMNYAKACENIQILTLIYSMVFIFYGFRIFKLMGLKGIGLYVSEALLAFHPLLTLLSGSVNNDMMSHMFLIMAVYYGLRWFMEDKLPYLLITALVTGLSMMAKLSGVLVAPALAFLMLYRFIIDIKEKGNIPKRISEYGLFGLVSVPLGLFFPIRNMVIFNVPLTYMPEVGEDVSSHGLLSRIFDIRTDTPYACMVKNGNSFDEFNIFLTLIKTGLTGEYDYGEVNRYITVFAWILFISGCLLFITDILLFILLLRGRLIKEVPIRIFWSILILTGVLFMLRLMITVPNFSSGDIRYIAWITVPAAMLPGLFAGEKLTGGGKIILAETAVFALSSMGVYYLLGMP